MPDRTYRRSGTSIASDRWSSSCRCCCRCRRGRTWYGWRTRRTDRRERTIHRLDRTPSIPHPCRSTLIGCGTGSSKKKTTNGGAGAGGGGKKSRRQRPVVVSVAAAFVVVGVVVAAVAFGDLRRLWRPHVLRVEPFWYGWFHRVIRRVCGGLRLGHGGRCGLPWLCWVL